MEQVNIIGIDLAKRTFQLHGARGDSDVAFRKKLSREKVLTFLAEQPRCVVAMEACGSAHHWGRAIRDLGHDVRLIPPVYVNPLSSDRRTTRRTRKRSRKPPAGRPCASSRSRTRDSRRAPCCFAPATCWCASAPS